MPPQRLIDVLPVQRAGDTIGQRVGIEVQPKPPALLDHRRRALIGQQALRVAIPQRGRDELAVFGQGVDRLGLRQDRRGFRGLGEVRIQRRDRSCSRARSRSA